MRALRYHYELAIITVLVSAELNGDVSSVFSLFDENEDQNIVKYGLVLILLYCHHRRNVV